MMTFEELWEETWKAVSLPNEAKQLLPRSLSDKTKQKLLISGRKPLEIADVVQMAVDEINHGSVESIDELVRRLLDEK